MNDGTTVRTFISIDPPPDLRNLLGQLRHHTAAPQSLRWIPERQIHLTLRFLGDIPGTAVDEVFQQLQQACAGVGSFELEARGVGCFPDARRPRVIWVGLGRDVDVLIRLRQRIGEATGNWGEQEDKPFHPHLTVARVRPPVPRGLSRFLAEAPGEVLGQWTVTEVKLMRSDLAPQGALHTLLHAVYL